MARKQGRQQRYQWGHPPLPIIPQQIRALLPDVTVTLSKRPDDWPAELPFHALSAQFWTHASTPATTTLLRNMTRLLLQHWQVLHDLALVPDDYPWDIPPEFITQHIKSPRWLIDRLPDEEALHDATLQDVAGKDGAQLASVMPLLCVLEQLADPLSAGEIEAPAPLLAPLQQNPRLPDIYVTDGRDATEPPAGMTPLSADDLLSGIEEGRYAIHYLDLINTTTTQLPTLTTELDLATALDRFVNNLPGLNDKKRKILQLRYGWLGQKPMTLQEVGDHYQVSREYIRQVQAAFEKRLAQQVPIIPSLGAVHAHLWRPCR